MLSSGETLKLLEKDSEFAPMRSYRGSLRVATTDDVIEAVFTIDEQNLAVSLGDEQLGSWPLHQIELDDMGSEILLSLDGENVVVNVVDHDSFVTAIAPPRRGRKSRHAKSKKQSRQPKQRKERPDVLGALRRAFDPSVWQEWLSSRVVKWSIASFAVIGVALLALFATNSLGTILVLLGMIALVIAGLAVSEDLTAIAWIPGNLSETTLVIAGVVAMTAGGLLILIS